VLFSSSRGLLTTNLALFSGLLQLPIPLGMDLSLTPGERVLRRAVADGTVHLAVAFPPVVEVAGGDVEPPNEAAGTDPGLLRPARDEIDDLVPQSSPISFLSATCSAISSARTSSFVWIFQVHDSLVVGGASVASSCVRSITLQGETPPPFPTE
jgi:hypothetical protein